MDYSQKGTQKHTKMISYKLLKQEGEMYIMGDGYLGLIPEHDSIFSSKKYYGINIIES